MHLFSVLYGVIIAQPPTKKVEPAEAICLEKMEICWFWQFDLGMWKFVGWFLFNIPGKPPLLTHGMYLVCTEGQWFIQSLKFFQAPISLNWSYSYNSSSTYSKGYVTEVEKAFQKYFELLAVYLIVDAHF